MVKITLSAMLGLALVGCASIKTPLDDGYEFGDGSRVVIGTAAELFSLRHAYCMSANAGLRSSLLDRIHEVRPGYPEEGLCTDFLGVGYEG